MNFKIEHDTLKFFSIEEEHVYFKGSYGGHISTAKVEIKKIFQVMRDPKLALIVNQFALIHNPIEKSFNLFRDNEENSKFFN
jgi:hypothetical protein